MMDNILPEKLLENSSSSFTALPPNIDLLSVDDSSSDDYNPPSMETNVADLDEEGADFENSPPPFISVEEDPSVFESYGFDDNSPLLPRQSYDKCYDYVSGVCGLLNIGNTCYMNAGLQCLLATDSVIQYFKTSSNINNNNCIQSQTELTTEFSNLFHEVWHGDSRVVHPLDFKESLSKTHPQFEGSQQHDCQEFLALLLDSMHEELKKRFFIEDEDYRKKKMETESRDSASSPKSYDSQSSSSYDGGKLSQRSSIRNMPLPLNVYNSWENEMTSIFLSHDSPKKLPLTSSSQNTESSTNQNAHWKENKTLNVNIVNSQSTGLGILNNEMNIVNSDKCFKEKNRSDQIVENSKENKRFNSRQMCNSDTKILSGEDEHGAEGLKRIRLESDETNFEMRLKRQDGSFEEENEMNEEEEMTTNTTTELKAVSEYPHHLKETLEADRYWEKYLALNNTVIAKSFHGQFKNTILCSSCQNVSVSFEPFMYLSVPLPNALIRQINYIFNQNAIHNTKCRLNMTQVDNVGCLKGKIRELCKVSSDKKLQVVEVFDHTISRHIEDWTSLKFLKEDKEIYVIEPIVYDPADSEDLIMEDFIYEEIQTCIICMEELCSNILRKHSSCNCLICKSCLTRIKDHQLKESLSCERISCPGCREEINIETEFVALDEVGKAQVKMKTFNINCSFRFKTSNGVKCFGSPFIASLPNIVSGKRLYRFFDSFLNESNYSLILVNSQGKMCSRCLGNNSCFGCVRLDRMSDLGLRLQSQDCLSVSYNEAPKDMYPLKEHESLQNNDTILNRLTLEDCLQAFSQEEVLDENNPWFCSHCQSNTCASKTLTIWRFPEYLIIHLKRFVFLSSGAVKLEIPVDFKLCSMDMTEYLSGPLSEGRPIFDLYGVVNHFGSVIGGHYTAFAKHEDWNYFDDCSIIDKKTPGSAVGDASSAYILFYQRKGGSEDFESRPEDCQMASSPFANLAQMNVSHKKTKQDFLL